jgi:hypothetical protein
MAIDKGKGGGYSGDSPTQKRGSNGTTKRRMPPRSPKRSAAGKSASGLVDKSRRAAGALKEKVSGAIRAGSKYTAPAARLAGKATVAGAALYGSYKAGHEVGTAINKKYKVSEKIVDWAESKTRPHRNATAPSYKRPKPTGNARSRVSP